MSAVRRAAARLTFPPDTWERHAIVARLAGTPRNVLDVGGVAGQLRLFLPGTEIMTVNVEGPADVVFDGERLPFDDASFDLVTSVDVIEHLERDERPRHLAELARVARSRVVACCPFGSAEHTQAESGLSDWYEETTGTRHRFLDEHLEHGLPREEELRAAAASVPGFRFSLRFHGDFRRTNEIFRRSVRASITRRPRELAAYAVGRFVMRPDYALAASPAPFTNRAYLVGEREGSHLPS